MEKITKAISDNSHFCFNCKFQNSDIHLEPCLNCHNYANWKKGINRISPVFAKIMKKQFEMLKNE